MIDVTPNLPEVVTEVRELFERYEASWIDRSGSPRIMPP